MKKNFTKVLSLILALMMVAVFTVPTFAESTYNFNDGAYASIVTGSDFQDTGRAAYQRFERVLTKMKDDGMGTPDSMLIGGDYSKFLPDSPAAGINLINEDALAVYPGLSEDSIVFIQGNHDIVSSAFTETGFYDMGSYLLYAINEDDYCWNQLYRLDAPAKIQAVADDLEDNLNNLIEAGDSRPVIVMTHVPLYYSSRSNGGDNKYSSILFDVLNEAGKDLDIVFLFGHNHSDNYDDYIGGSVNFLTCGDTILIPETNGLKVTYTEETLNFTYTNYGYIGYSGNSVTETSTNVLTLGNIRLTNDSIIFLKYSGNGLFRENTVARKNTGTENAGAQSTTVFSTVLWQFVQQILKLFPLFTKLFAAISY